MVVQGDTALEVSALIQDFDAKFWGDGGCGWLSDRIGAVVDDLPVIDLAEVRMGSPVPKPSKVVCIGLNYLDHIRETGSEVPNEPVVFMKAPNTVVGPNDDLIIPPGSTKTDYEVELAVVIGTECRYLTDEAAALESIAGYAISNDVSEREYQLERGGQWVKGKSSETFNPLGPFLVTPDEILDVGQLDLFLSVNGETTQHSHTGEMVFSVGYLVWYLSQFMVLEPGDLINTGTPHGVGLGMDVPRYLAPGDIIEVSISGLGSQMTLCRAFQEV